MLGKANKEIKMRLSHKNKLTVKRSLSSKSKVYLGKNILIRHEGRRVRAELVACLDPVTIATVIGATAAVSAAVSAIRANRAESKRRLACRFIRPTSKTFCGQPIILQEIVTLNDVQFLRTVCSLKHVTVCNLISGK